MSDEFASDIEYLFCATCDEEMPFEASRVDDPETMYCIECGNPE